MFFLSLKEYLPKEYIKVKGIEKKIFQVIFYFSNFFLKFFLKNLNINYLKRNTKPISMVSMNLKLNLNTLNYADR